MTLHAGDKAPDFAAKDEQGNTVKLSDFKGKKVVLYFYPRDMTPGCTAEACSLRDNYKVLQKQGYEVLGVSTDTEKSHQKFIAKEKLPFRLLADPDKKLHDAYGTWVEKSMYGRKYMGTARVTFVINENGILDEVIEKVDTKNHADQILKQNPAATKAAPKKTIVKKAAPKKTAAKKAARKTSPATKAKKSTKK
jgi:peroxiredoxin Q/BCP